MTKWQEYTITWQKHTTQWQYDTIPWQMTKPHHTMTKPPHILTKEHHTLSKEPRSGQHDKNHTMSPWQKKPHHTPTKEHIMTKAYDVMTKTHHTITKHSWMTFISKFSLSLSLSLSLSQSLSLSSINWCLRICFVLVSYICRFFYIWMHANKVFTFCLCRRHADGDLLKRANRRRDCVPDRCYEGLGGPSGALARGVEGQGGGQTQHGGRGG